MLGSMSGERAMHTLSRRNVMRLSLLAAALPLSTSAFAAWGAPLAIQGYDPVAYFTFGKPTHGLPEFEYEWDEHRYRFARPEHLELFKADPVRYAPQFAGFCAVALARGDLDEGNPEYWLLSEGKLYLFGKPIGPALFQQDIAGNLVKAEQNRPRIVNR
jgi:YHS domain-containing protein